DGITLSISAMTARIVIVEDDPSVAELVTLYLRNAEFIVAHARTAAEARVKIDETKPALIVLDLGLPDTNGLHLFKQIRGRADTRSPPRGRVGLRVSGRDAHRRRAREAAPRQADGRRRQDRDRVGRRIQARGPGLIRAAKHRDPAFPLVPRGRCGRPRGGGD